MEIELLTKVSIFALANNASIVQLNGILSEAINVAYGTYIHIEVCSKL